MTTAAEHFSDQRSVTDYAARTLRLVPALSELHRMMRLLLAESLSDQARLLVLGAGGGLELKALAEHQPDWQLLGVDPSSAMLEQARLHLGDLQQRITLQRGVIHDVQASSHDAAVCLLTLHFLPEVERRDTLQAIAERLKPGAPLVVAHHSFALEQGRHDRWLSRLAEWAVQAGIPASHAQGNSQAMKQNLPVLSPVQDERILHEAGFEDIELFYTALTFRGWICRRR